MCQLLYPSNKPLTSEEQEAASSNPASARLLGNTTNRKEFQTNLCGAPRVAPCTCCGATLCQFTGLTGYLARRDVLQLTQSEYTCCQGLCSDSFFIPECRNSDCANYCEAVLCPTLSISITRAHLMQNRDLRPDPVDYQLIRCSNCLQLMSCFCNGLACCMVVFIGRDLAEIAIYSSRCIDLVACCFASSVSGCMYVQVMNELHFQKEEGNVTEAVVVAVVEAQEIERK